MEDKRQISYTEKFQIIYVDHVILKRWSLSLLFIACWQHSIICFEKIVYGKGRVSVLWRRWHTLFWLGV